MCRVALPSKALINPVNRPATVINRAHDRATAAMLNRTILRRRRYRQAKNKLSTLIAGYSPDPDFVAGRSSAWPILQPVLPASRPARA